MVLYKCKLNMCSPLRGCAVLARVFGQEGWYIMIEIKKESSEFGTAYLLKEGYSVVGIVTYYSDGIRITVFDSKDRLHTIRLNEIGEIVYTISNSRLHKINLHGKRKIEKMFLGISLQFNIPLPNRITLDD